MTQTPAKIALWKTCLAVGVLAAAFLIPLLVVILTPDATFLMHLLVFTLLAAFLTYLFVPVSQDIAELPERLMLRAHRAPTDMADHAEARARLDRVARYVAVLRGDDQYRDIPIHLQADFSATRPGQPVNIRISPKWNTTMSSMMPTLTAELSTYLHAVFLQGEDTRRFSRLANFSLNFKGQSRHSAFAESRMPSIYSTPLTLHDIPNHQRLAIIQDLQAAEFLAAAPDHPRQGTDR